ncbi:hypothetical protein MMO39_12610 [Acinetobacter modestus]|uniref:hypothetical protein n=1 Tax=Acinetobacter modestus TaxID=1776740 RepID=UPI001F4A64EF|nr:hypothetical protein [Acinetobacter modestus]MCH7388134.1 hypothetical protein [Acinetobacter modestus]
MKKIIINTYHNKNENLLLAGFVIMVCLIISLAMILFYIKKEYISQYTLWVANIELYEKYQLDDMNAGKIENPKSQISLNDLDQLMSVRSNKINFDRLRYTLDGILEVEGSCSDLMDLTSFIDAAQAVKIDIEIKRVSKDQDGFVEFELERK